LNQRSLVRKTIAAAALTIALGAATALAQGPTVSLRGCDGHGRPFDLARLRGSVVAVTFTSRYTRDEALRVNDALAARADVKVVTVVDFVGIPSFVRGYARRKVAEADDGRIQHVVDEAGRLRGAFGADPAKLVDIFVIDRDGGLRGHFRGARELAPALQLVDDMRGAAAE
jgi:hypothetical protein